MPTGSRERVRETLSTLQSGVTEIHVQPVIDSPEVRALTSVAEAWIDDLALVTHDPLIPELLERAGAVTIGYAELRSAMRAS